MIKYVLFDVAGTLLNKPVLFVKIQEALIQFGHDVALEEIKYKHKLLSEIIHFPDRTDESFYKKFNSDLLYLLGIVPTEALLAAVFNNCTYLPWEKFADTSVLSEIELPIGVVSNFNSTLKEKLNQHFGPVFSNVFVSEEMGVAKPSLVFYQKAIEKLALNPGEILYIGDSIKLDLEPALKLGMKSFVIDRDNFYPKNPNRMESLLDLKSHL